MENFMLFTSGTFAKAIAVVSIANLLAGCDGGSSSGDSNVMSSSPVTSSAPGSAAASGQIKLNQLGFLPESMKVAVIPNVATTRFKLVKAGSTTEVFSGDLATAATWDASGEQVKLADF